ncbi:hypothetical protein HMPREF0766_10300 [Sphingobacterium spiritivorum ATCC 33861]|uniref:Uncharacterized protein n=1 Tax=Sphingobacterium spiritivorum ATCC 33861 TaxID=525373 RepID=D7VH31_SPHSI|nr:hypothetical protein HMPREF0766_10300 [Sphingobacterium spiritivorum ATCC 33861]
MQALACSTTAKEYDEKEKPLSSVSVFLREFNQYFFTDKDGQFAFNRMNS